MGLRNDDGDGDDGAGGDDDGDGNGVFVQRHRKSFLNMAYCMYIEKKRKIKGRRKRGRGKWLMDMNKTGMSSFGFEYCSARVRHVNV